MPTNKKLMREKGKLRLSRYFQDFKEGDRVSVLKDAAVYSSFPLRLQGKTGVVEGKRGQAFIVKIKTENKEKKFIIDPIHLKKIEQLL
jgi:large subunit ribosomal protein L21e